MNDQSYAKIVNNLPAAGTRDLRKEISSRLKSQGIKIVVLDDDPTGIQTVHDCLLLTKWTPEILDKALGHQGPLFYILTNSRSMDEPAATSTTREVMQSVLKANNRHHYKLIFISRSDSTLRGHFPAEPEAMLSVLRSMHIPLRLPVFFVPAFLETGRCTVNNVHYARTGDRMMPVSETEFARDSVFAYSHSNLSRYIIEKSNGNISEDQIGTIPLAELRRSGPGDLQRLL